MLNDPLFLVAINLCVAALIRILSPNMLTGLLLAIVLIASTGYLGSHHGTEVLMNAYRGRDAALSFARGLPAWPPEKFRSYPNLKLVDRYGRQKPLADFRGKVILVQPIAMTSPACVAFSGGHQYGNFLSTGAQENLDSIDTYIRQFGHISLEHDDLVFVQIMLFNAEMKPPTVDDLARWADHFRMTPERQRFVLAGTAEQSNGAGHDLVPGFQLIDRHFILRANATGATPDDSLYTDLIPLIPKLIKEN